MNIKIRRAGSSEAAAVSAIGRSTFHETWSLVNTEEDLKLYMDQAFDEDKMRHELEASDVFTYLFAFVDDELAGYAKLRNDRTYPQLNNEKSLEIERIYVLKKFHDKKIGKALMDESIAIAKREKYFWLWLGVNQENTKAMNFYERYGFQIFGTKQFILGKAVDEDNLMRLRL